MSTWNHEKKLSDPSLKLAVREITCAIRAAFADREKNRKSLVSGGGSGGGGGRAGVVAAADSKMVSADSKMVSADSKLVSANFTGHLQQFYFTSSRNSFFTKIKEI